jgi:hypothetical protein
VGPGKAGLVAFLTRRFATDEVPGRVPSHRTGAVVHEDLERGPAARRVFERDPEWIAPILWRSEFRNVLANYIRGGSLPLEGGQAIMAKAEELFAGAEFQVASDAEELNHRPGGRLRPQQLPEPRVTRAAHR